jgi:hypothetical protein
MHNDKVKDVANELLSNAKLMRQDRANSNLRIRVNAYTEGLERAKVILGNYNLLEIALIRAELKSIADKEQPKNTFVDFAPGSVPDLPEYAEPSRKYEDSLYALRSANFVLQTRTNYIFQNPEPHQTRLETAALTFTARILSSVENIIHR